VQLKEALSSAITRLTARPVAAPRLDAEVLLMFVLGCDRAYLHAHPERELTASEELRLENALSARLSGLPMQYITGHQEFWGLDFLVSPAVLIPRPETEHIIEAVMEIARAGGAGAKRAPGDHGNPRIVDVGTGSGCIAVALAKEFPAAEIWATDISATALQIAKRNAARYDFGSRIRFCQADLLTAFDPGVFDFVVSNPPYVGTSEQGQLQTEVRDFEPRAALFAGADGLQVIRRLLPAARLALKPGGHLVMEIGSSQYAEVMELMRDWDDSSLKLDLQSLPRIVHARRSDDGV